MSRSSSRALVPFSRVGPVLDPSRDPAAVYLATLAPTGRRAQAQALRAAAGLLAPGDTLPWHLLRYQHVAAVRAFLLGRGYAPATINRWLGALRGVLRHAWLLGLTPAEEYQRACQVPPARGDRLPPGRAPAKAEIQELLNTSGPRDRAAFALLYGAGLRSAEACSLRLVDLQTGALVVVGKGNRQRRVPLRPWVSREVAAWLAVRQSPAQTVLVSQAGEPMHPNTLASALARAQVRAGLEHLSPHDLRRAFVSHLLDADVRLDVAQELCGHADPRTTAKYARHRERAAAKAVEHLDL